MLRLTSAAFNHDSEIPLEFTCDGRNVSPPVSWSGPPPGTRSFALIMHDPDAPMPGGYTHWLVYNIPSTVDSIPENVPHQDQLPGGGIQGKNSGGTYGYTGPCPPSGTHRYYFRLYALDSALDPSSGANQDALKKSIEGHILGEAELMGRYRRASHQAA
jgi:Raf kinase inhibitor-like YbhB/YbcL family protein